MTTKEAIQAMLNGEKVTPIDTTVWTLKYCYFDGQYFRDNNDNLLDFNYVVGDCYYWKIYTL